MIFAIVENGVCVNTVSWDGGEEWAPPPGMTAVQIDELSPMPGVEWTLSGSTWTAPAPSEPAPDLYNFSNALTTSTVLSAAERTYLVGWLAGLAVSLSNGDLTTIVNGWSAIKASGLVSTNSINSIESTAATYNIPGIT